MRFGLKLIGQRLRPSAASAVSCALVRDVAHVVRIETFRATPLVVDSSAKANLVLDRTLSRRFGLVVCFPATHGRVAYRRCMWRGKLNDYRHPRLIAGSCVTAMRLLSSAPPAIRTTAGDSPRR